MPAGPYTITLSADDMTAWLCFHVDTPVPWEQLHADLATAGIVYGIDQFLLADLAAAHKPGTSYCIARGSPPDDGLEYGFCLNTERTPRRLADGRVDFYNLDTVQNVLQQQILVAKVPPIARQAGHTVRGAIIPPTQEDVALPAPGVDVALSPDGTCLIALTNGYPVLVDNVLHLETTYTVEGNVDFTTGNLTCVGHVAVTGDVKNGFSIKSAQDVTVHGVVDGGVIDAGGTACLYGNVFGQHKSRIASAASVHGTYITAATVEARKNIVLERGARHSNLCAGGSVMVKGNEGHIIGGTVRAHERVLSHHLGCEREIPTQIDILPGGYDVTTGATFLAYLEAILQDDDNGLAQGLYDHIPTAHAEELRHLLRQGHNAVQCLTAYLQARQRLLPIVPLQIGTVVATGTVHPGVTVCIGNASLLIREPITGVMFCNVDNAVQIRALEALSAC